MTTTVSIEAALSYIPPHDRDTWIKVAMAVKSELSEAGRDVWERWSMGADSYNPRDAAAVWRSTKASGGITIASLFHLAKEHGFDLRTTTPPPPQSRQQLAERKARAESEQAKLEQRRAEATQKALLLWRAGSPARGNPYLERKGVAVVNTLRQIEASEATTILGYPPKSRDGEELTGILLIVPIKVDGIMSSCQLIAANGGKHNLSGGRIGGGYWATGSFPDGTGEGLTVLIAEGVATALSCHEAAGCLAIAGMNCDNLSAAARWIRNQYPEALPIVCSDKGNGENEARRAAIESGALLAVPVIDGEGSDFNDIHLSKGLKAVRKQIEAAGKPIVEPTLLEKTTPELQSESRIKVIDFLDFMALKFPPRENLLHPWLPRQGLTMVYASRGVGKTHFSLGVAFAVASGGLFLNWQAPTPCGVLFIDGEMPASVLKERLTRIEASSDLKPEAPLRIITPDTQPNGMINISDPSDQNTLEPFLDGIDLIILDNLSTLCRSGKENEGESWLPVQQWALQQRAKGRSILFIHHAGKNGEQRGSSRREDVLDTVIGLKRPGDYTEDKGACFEVHFEKARGLFGDDTKPFEVQLLTTENETQIWTITPLEQSTVEKVAAALNEGIPQKEIADLLKIAKGTVSKAKKQAQEQGLIKVS